MTESSLRPSRGAPVPLARMAELRQRLRAAGRPVAVLCLGAAGRGAPGGVPVQTLVGLLEDLPALGERAVEVLGDQVLVLLEADPQSASLAAELLVESGRRLSRVPGDSRRWIGLHLGLALDPASRELFLETLVAVAREGAAVARARGGECAVHTRLYDLVQRRLERERGAAPAAPVPEAPTAVVPGPASAAPEPASARASSPPEPRRAELEARLRERWREQERARLARPAPAAATPPAPVAEAPAPQPAPERTGAASDDPTLLRLARAMAAEALATERRELDRRHRDEVDLLERRIQRLLRALEENEAELARLAAAAALEPGVPSAPRALEGRAALAAGDAARRELMSKLLEANLELRRRMAERAA